MAEHVLVLGGLRALGHHLDDLGRAGGGEEMGGADVLRPEALFGLKGLDYLTHSLFWSLLANAGLYFAVSLARGPSAREAAQALLFVDVFERTGTRAMLIAALAAQAVDEVHDHLGVGDIAPPLEGRLHPDLGPIVASIEDRADALGAQGGDRVGEPHVGEIAGQGPATYIDRGDEAPGAKRRQGQCTAGVSRPGPTPSLLWSGQRGHA